MITRALRTLIVRLHRHDGMRCPALTHTGGMEYVAQQPHLRRPADPILFLQRHWVCARQPLRLLRALAPHLYAVRAGLFVAMITVAAKRMITALKIRNLAVFDAGTTSEESWLIAASKLAWKIATSSCLCHLRQDLVPFVRRFHPVCVRDL
jgi:hypothetical protein